MKKLLILILLALSTTSVFANKNSSNDDKKNEPSCRASCSVSVNINGVTYTVETSAGSIFTSCETAGKNCQKKLMHKLVDLVYQ